MVGTIDIPKGLLVFLEGPCTPKWGKSRKSTFLWENCKISNISCIFHKNLKICCFPHFPVKRVSGITNNPLGLSMVSALEAEGPPFYQEYRKSMGFHEKTMISAKFHEFHAFFVKWRPRRPHGWNHLYSLGNICVLGRPCNRKIQNSRKTSVFMVKTENSAKNQKIVKLLKSRDFPYFPVYGDSGATNDSLGISTFSAMGA